MRTHPSIGGDLVSRPSQGPRRRLAGTVLLTVLLGLAAVAATPEDPAEAGRWAYGAILRVRGGTPVSFPGVVLQSGPSDCGPAALATLLRTLGESPPSTDSIATLAGTGARGTTFAGLVRAARALGLEPELRRLDSAALVALDTPVIAWVDEGHFVTVVPDPPGSALVLDPLVGAYRMDLRALRRFWGGEALLARPLRTSADPAGEPLEAGGRS